MVFSLSVVALITDESVFVTGIGVPASSPYSTVAPEDRVLPDVLVIFQCPNQGPEPLTLSMADP